ncbi:uncharacterized protein N7473_001723 [Penicillium subrubescens]|uniref:uncharacterized protein n=1 Tax=Penicillium subrubescens TaxID=1316194 RepID=UPI00254541AB|nr:uncharacterized protein N7473_001723 [Penicillium subrubescens]KAJ5904807.1 hypothetical protein N7473_001723 [Penicillium subrubescens]
MQRRHRSSDESGTPSSAISSTLHKDIDLTSRLSALLDAARNEELTFELQILPSAEPHEVLSRVLSPSSVVSTASSSTFFFNAQQVTIKTKWISAPINEDFSANSKLYSASCGKI